MKIFDTNQRSEQWHRVRLGRPTASQFHRIVSASGSASKQARVYLNELLWQRLTGQDTAKDLSRIPAVQWGVEHEDEACAQFEAIEGRALERIGFCMTDDGRMGASPDRVIAGTNEGVEVKCPMGPTHVGYLLSQFAGIPQVAGTDPMDAYYPQVMGQMFICQFDRLHFFSYHPAAPAFLRSFEPDRAYFVKMLPLLNQFCDALDQCERMLRSMGTFEGDPLPGFPEEEEASVASGAIR
jgi:putative phage-type endonuclease